MKRYITEKQLEQLKNLIEKLEELPEHICERFYADYVEPIDGAVSEYQYQKTMDLRLEGCAGGMWRRSKR